MLALLFRQVNLPHVYSKQMLDLLIRQVNLTQV
jgi:hypothetical protein